MIDVSITCLEKMRNGQFDIIKTMDDTVKNTNLSNGTQLEYVLKEHLELQGLQKPKRYMLC